MGRPRTPAALKKLCGKLPDDLDVADDPGSPAGSGPCPDHLDDVGRDAWRRVTSRLDEMGLLTLSNAELIALYASTYEQWDEARREVARDGMTFTSPMGLIKPHPLLSTIKECRSQMIRLLSQCGMTPSSRSSLHVQGKPEDDPIRAFFAPQKPKPKPKAKTKPKPKPKPKAKA